MTSVADDKGDYGFDGEISDGHFLILLSMCIDVAYWIIEWFHILVVQVGVHSRYLSFLVRLVLEPWPAKAALLIVDLDIGYCRAANPPT